MPKRHPDRYLIQMWPQGNGMRLYLSKSIAPKWVLNRGMLRSPCDIAGCKELVPKGSWYVRHPSHGIVCERCAEEIAQRFPPGHPNNPD